MPGMYGAPSSLGVRVPGLWTSFSKRVISCRSVGARDEAYGASAVMGAVMAVLFYPAGTLLYLYWIIRLRKRERVTNPGSN